MGEHIKRRRLTLGLQQKELAAQLGVTPRTIANWEQGETQVPVGHMPALLAFLGYDPFPQAKSIAERLRAKRRAFGWTIRKAAAELGVDPGTWGAWESNKKICLQAHRTLLAKLLSARA